MKKYGTKALVFGLIIFLSPGAKGQQSFPGYRSGNYSGVNGVFFNPANIADSRYRWDVNLFSINAGLGNNNASFKLKDITKGFDGNVDSLLFGSSDKNTNGSANLDLFGPSFMFNAGPKLSFALSTRVRAVANVNDVDGKFIQSVDNSINQSTPFLLSSSANQKIVVNGWSEIGASIGMVLKNKGKHFWKGGVTVKYVAGTTNSFANINKMRATVNNDISGNVYITNATGTVAIGNSGVNLENIDLNNAFKFSGNGIGGDFGIVYEYRPGGEKSDKYKYKFGFSVLDFGIIRYKLDPSDFANYTLDISGTEQWYPSELNGKSISEIKTYLDSKPQFFTNNSTSSSAFKEMWLPSTVQVNFDCALSKKFSVELAGQMNLVNKDDFFSSFAYNTVTLTPRFEGRHFGVYIPVNYNELTDLNAGISLRAGPLFLGSGSIFTALLDKSKQADVHFGIRFGALQKKGKKIKKAPATDDKKPEIKVTDSDNDGINDNEDKCPTESGVIRYGGCPVPDTDNDGVNDEEDKCPSQQGVIRYGGCPVPDTDGDGVNDDDDRCPKLAGAASNQGCPEIKKEIAKKIQFAAQRILFQSGKSVLIGSSYRQLDQVVLILNQDKDLKLTVDGHTDNSGIAEKNQALSESRANAVKAYLVKKGITEKRIIATGYGDIVPVADNTTAAGRQQNRRVELKLDY